MAVRDQAICLRATDYSETSQVVHFLTRAEGVVRLIAKGSKRKKSKSGGAIDLMSEGDLVYIDRPGGALGTLTEFHESVSHLAVRGSSARLNAALYLLELTGRMLPEGDPHPRVFDLLHNALGRLGDADAPVGAVVAFFQWRLLRHAGLLGPMDACMACGLDLHAPAGPVHFSSAAGGLICDTCRAEQREKVRVSAQALAGLDVLRRVSAGERTNFQDDSALAVNRLLAYHVACQLGRPLRMARHVMGKSTPEKGR